MNERIFELCIQAKREFDEHVAECEQLGKQIEWVTEERLVELVVRECMRMCDVAQVGYLTHGHVFQGQGCQGAKQYIADWFEV